MPTVRATTSYKVAGTNVTYTLAQTQVALKAKMTHYSIYGARDFVFPYAPVEVSYTGLARQYTELNRPGDWALLDSISPQLMKVAIQFRVADPNTHGQASIESQLDNLRLISLVPGTIVVTNMDAYLSRPIAPTVEYLGMRLAVFRITDLSVNVKRRNRDNEATQADCQLTLTEDRNPYVPVVSLAPIDYVDQPTRVVGSVGTSGGGGGSEFNSFLDGAQRAGQYTPPAKPV
jgi:hypothetical protein